MHARVDGKCCGVDRVVALDNFAFVIDQDQVGHTDLSEVDAEGVYPEPVRIARVACRDVARHALVEAEARKQAEGGVRRS